MKRRTGACRGILVAVGVTALSACHGSSGTTEACTYTFTDWSACAADGTQTRAVDSSGPSGCTGTPVLSRACSDVPAATDFFTSFEAGEPQPTWVSTAEKASGVNGLGFNGVNGIPGNIAVWGKIAAVTASAENPTAEVKENLVDGDVATKWLTRNTTGWVTFTLNTPVAVSSYALTSANDAADRDPQDWTLEGSNDGAAWTAVDVQTGQSFPSRFATRQYPVATPASYSQYRLTISKNWGSALLQLAEVELSDGGTAEVPRGDMRALVGNGPASTYAAKAGVGFTGLRALQYGGRHDASGAAYAYDKVLDVELRVTAETELSYLIFPELTGGDLRYPSTYASVDLAFSDGTYLSELGAVDQLGYRLDPQSQGASKALYANQWNRRVSSIGAVASGKTIRRILVAYQNPSGPAMFQGWVDDVRIAGAPVKPARTRPSEWVLTTRGTHANGTFSRGNNFPATAVPHGFNFWTPMTDAGSTGWLYQYHAQNDASNLPSLQAFAASHEPSPWMGDRQTFQVMPVPGMGVPSAKRATRALTFRHENEVAQAHFYAVTFENGMKTELAPTDHAAIFRFTFTGANSNVVFDNVSSAAAVALDPAAGVVTGWSDVRSGLSSGATRMFLYARFDEAPIGGGKLAGNGSPLSDAGYLKFDTTTAKTVTLRVATSLISVDQARHNLELEIADTDTLEAVKERAQQAWDAKLSVIAVEGATDDQLTTLYSSLYRLNLYPNSGYENAGTASAPAYRHAVQSSTSTPSGSTATQTSAPVVDGKVYVNNGFWDTYRTAWAAYSLLYPTDAGEMVDGFLQQYRDGGWVSRWSSPGYANLMTGTSSDVAFADAYLRGVTGFDPQVAYAAALRNATVTPPNDSVGRKGQATGLFLGYTPSSTGESVSWALEGWINDYGIGNMALALARDATLPAADRQRYAEEGQYFLLRSRNYVNLFDSTLTDPGLPGQELGGFFQTRAASGAWTFTPDAYDPRTWGNGYTETNGWNFAFHAPHDGQGLANLLGGTDVLAAKLDAFFATAETASSSGIHEATEARDVRMGQWGLSNQVSHHIPFLYAYAGQPAKLQAIAREALRRCFSGSEIGQGYPGDEDNGEMSAWWVFNALGLYPLQMGSPTYVIGSPLFRKATVHLESGKDLVISAPANGPDAVYVQGLTVNGEAYAKSWLFQADVARVKGATLEFAMGTAPSAWATGADAAPPSLTTGEAAPAALMDVALGGTATNSLGTSTAALFDDSSATTVTFAGTATPWIQYQLPAAAPVGFYTLTSVGATGSEASDPTGWVLQGSNDGATWDTLDERSGETFTWRQQTRAFMLPQLASYGFYRLEVTGNGGGANTALAEVELLGDPSRTP